MTNAPGSWTCCLLLLAALTLTGCGPAAEETFGIPSKSIREAIVVASGEIGWTVVSDESNDTEGVIEVESPAGQRARVEFRSQGEEATWVGVKGAEPDRLIKAIRDLVQ